MENYDQVEKLDDINSKGKDSIKKEDNKENELKSTEQSNVKENEKVKNSSKERLR